MATLHRFGLLGLACLLLAACGAATAPSAPVTAACSTAAMATYASAVAKLAATYQQQAELTAATPRASIGTPLQRLLDVQQETQALDVPPCLAAYHARIVAAMQLQQQGFQDFAANRGDTAASAKIAEGASALATAAAQLGLVEAGQVPPTPAPAPPPTATPVPPTPGLPPPPPTPTPPPVGQVEPVDPPTPARITTAVRLVLQPGIAPGSTDPWLCGESTVEIVRRANVLGSVWYEVRVVEPTQCVAPRAEVGATGWVARDQIAQ